MKIVNIDANKVVYIQDLDCAIMQGKITSYGGLFYILYDIVLGIADNANGTLVIDPSAQKVVGSMNVSYYWEKVNVPTFCQDGSIMVVYNNYNKMWVFSRTQLDSGNIDFKLLWNYTWNNTDIIPLYRDVVCIEYEDTNDRLFLQHDKWNWQVLDAVTGDILISYNWEDPMAETLWPLIHQNKKIMIYDKYGVYGLYAMNISDPDPNNWKDIWAIDMNDLNGGALYLDAIIVDDYVFLTFNGNETKVLDINNGSNTLWKYEIGESNPYLYPGLAVTPGLDQSGKPTLIVIKQVTQQRNVIHGFQ